MMTNDAVTAAVVLIGDEILSGRTRDVNLQQIAQFLAPMGIQVRECRTVPDVSSDIAAAVNALRARFTYVFTTGGIGPTHDDITADAIGEAFGRPVEENAEALAILEARYRETGTEFTAARRRMARMPEGAELIHNPVSGAPGFRVENVFVMAGVPAICRGMLDSIGPMLEGGEVVHTITLRVPGLREGEVGEALGRIAMDMPDLDIGSYPWFRSMTDSGVHLLARGTDRTRLEEAATRLQALVREAGRTPERLD